MRARLLQVTIAVIIFLIPTGWISIAQTPAPPAGAVALHVEGTVLDSVTGKPIEGATVSGGKTDAAGRFAVDLRPGTTMVQVSKEGYSNGKLPGRSFPTTVPLQSVANITLSAGQPWNDLVVYLNPSASITGKIFDAQGQPMQDAMVQPFVYLYSPAGTRYRLNVAGNTTKTNDLGAFKIDRLDVGDYYFEIRPSSPDLGGGMVLAPVFYPNAIDEARAEPVHVDAGATVQMKNVTLPAVRGANVSVRLVNNSGEEPRAGGAAFVGRVDGVGVALKSLTLPKEKLLEVQDLGAMPPGHYFAYGGFATNSPGVAEARVYFDIAGSDVQLDMPVNKIKPLSLTGRAVMEDAANTPRPVAGIKLVFHEIGAASSLTTLTIAPATFVSQADGSFMMQGTRTFSPTVPPYAYRIRPADLPPGMYVKAIRGVDAEMFKPEPGQPLDVTVVVGNDAGTLEGIVKDTKGVKVALGAVVLIPDEPNSSPRIATATSAANGAYKIQAGPGAYHLYAWHELIGAPYLNPEFMSKISDKGVAVRITANGRATMDLITF